MEAHEIQADSEKIKKQIERYPQNHINYYRLANYYRLTEKSYKKSIEMYKKSLILGGPRLECYYGIIECCCVLEEYIDLERFCKKALNIYPVYKSIPHRYGYCLLKKEKFHELYDFSHSQLMIKDDYIMRVMMAFSALELERADEAVVLMKNLDVNVNDSLTICVLAAAYRKLGNLDDAENIILKGLKKNPDDCGLINELIQTFSIKKQTEEAIELTYRYLQIKPNDPEMMFRLGVFYLDLGKYKEGLALYEKRLDCKHRQFMPAVLEKLPDWDGANIENYSLLVIAEQGSGDAIHYSRYIISLKSRLRDGGKIMLYVRPPLYRLFVEMFPEEKVLTDGMVGVANYKVMLMSLPFYLFGDMINVPDPVDIKIKNMPGLYMWNNRTDNSMINIGLCWTGNKRNPMNSLRAIQSRQFFEMLLIDAGITYHSLHHKYDEQSAIIQNSVCGIIDHGSDIEDFLDVALLLSEMDLIITVDTAVAHLAATLKIPTWLLITYYPDWRWGEFGETTRWYDSMRIYRQEKPFDWSAPLRNLNKDLHYWYAEYQRNTMELHLHD